MPVIVLAGLDRVSMVTLRERNGELAPSQVPGKGFFHLNRDGISRIQCESACIDSGNLAVRLSLSQICVFTGTISLPV